MLEDTLLELVEIYLRRANVPQETIEAVIANRTPITLTARWLLSINLHDEDELEENPLEW